MSQIDIPRLIDLALVTPETGNLNLKILHKVLHAIASQLNFKTTKTGLKENLEPRKITNSENFTKEYEENFEQTKTTELDDKEFPMEEYAENFQNTEPENSSKENEENFDPIKTTKLDVKENWTKENEENLKTMKTKEDDKNSNLDEKENVETLVEDTEGNIKETKSHKDLCLSKKVDQLRKNLCHLEKSIYGINFQKLKETFGKENPTKIESLDVKIIDNENKSIFPIKENHEMKNTSLEIKESFRKLDRRLKITESIIFDKIEETSIKFDELNNKISQSKIEASDKLSKLEKLFCENQKELSEIWDEVDCCVKFNKTSKLNFDNIFETLKATQIDSEKSSKETKKLFDENENRRKEVKFFNDKLELLNHRKANLDEMYEKLSLKSDKNDMEKRAFTKRCEQNRQENSQAILEAFEKLLQIENFFKSELDNLQSIIDEKSTKIKLEDKTRFLENKLKLANETFFKITNFKNIAEAAITTSEYQKDLKCISCSNSVMMKRHENTTSIPRMGLLMKNTKSAEEDFRQLDTDRIKTRFTGGKHTILDPKEKLVRVGDFRNENVIFHYPTAEVKYIKGNDGVLYRADTTIQAKICKI